MAAPARSAEDESSRSRDAVLRRLREQARTMTPREVAEGLRDAFDRNDLLTYASAISFQVFFALIPLALFALGLLGGSGLEQVYTRDVAPTIRDNVSGPAFQVIDDTVTQILGSRQLFWLTIGGAIAVWEMSGAMRAVMGVLDRIYRSTRERSFRDRLVTSTWLGAAVGALLLGALGTVEVLPRMLGDGALRDIAEVVRWPAAVLLLFAAIALVVRVAPADDRDAGWVTLGSSLAVVGWLGSSLVFGWYVTSVADYGSVFGALSVVIVILTYLYISAIAFLTGVQLDALVQQRLDGDGE